MANRVATNPALLTFKDSHCCADMNAISPVVLTGPRINKITFYSLTTGRKLNKAERKPFLHLRILQLKLGKWRWNVRNQGWFISTTRPESLHLLLFISGVREGKQQNKRGTKVMCACSVHILKYIAGGTKLENKSCVSENQVGNSNLDHNMNFICNFSTVITDIESKLEN